MAFPTAATIVGPCPTCQWPSGATTIATQPFTTEPANWQSAPTDWMQKPLIPLDESEAGRPVFRRGRSLERVQPVDRLGALTVGHLDVDHGDLPVGTPQQGVRGAECAVWS